MTTSTDMQRHYALVGYPLEHSWSQRWFEDMFRRRGLHGCSYTLHEMRRLDGLRQWVDDEDVSGFNVTSPHKVDIIPLLDGLSDTARAIGAVNCVTVSRRGAVRLLIGHNTDAPAFAESYASAGCWSEAFVLGTGGAAHAVAHALRQKGICTTFVSRSPRRHASAIGYDAMLLRLGQASRPLLVNATPVGMYPDVERSPVDLSLCDADLTALTLIDLIYNPSPTLLMRQAAAHGATVHDGLAMLRRQAELSWELFG